MYEWWPIKFWEYCCIQFQFQCLRIGPKPFFTLHINQFSWKYVFNNKWLFKFMDIPILQKRADLVHREISNCIVSNLGYICKIRLHCRCSCRRATISLRNQHSFRCFGIALHKAIFICIIQYDAKGSCIMNYINSYIDPSIFIDEADGISFSFYASCHELRQIFVRNMS